jgi:hypothetical protein
MSLAAGSRLGSYEILSAIGAGGMGEVYRARDTKLDRDVAIKVLPSWDLRRRLTHLEDDGIGTGEKGHRRCRRLDPRERRPVASSLPTFAGRTALWPSTPPADDSPDTCVSGPPCIRVVAR